MEKVKLKGFIFSIHGGRIQLGYYRLTITQPVAVPGKILQLKYTPLIGRKGLDGKAYRNIATFAGAEFYTYEGLTYQAIKVDHIGFSAKRVYIDSSRALKLNLHKTSPMMQIVFKIGKAYYEREISIYA